MPLEIDKILPLLMEAEVAYASRFPKAPATPELVLEIDAAGVRLVRPAKDGMSCAFMNVAAAPIAKVTQLAASVYAGIPKEALPVRIAFEISRMKDRVRPVRMSFAGFPIDTPLVERRFPALLEAFRAMADRIGDAGQPSARWAILTRLPASNRDAHAGEIHAASARGAVLKYLVCHLGCDSPARLEQVIEMHGDLLARTRAARVEGLPADRLLAIADCDPAA